jgi:putative transposon-encoded protein
MMMNKWNINKVEGKPTKFGTGAHITLPKDWLEKDVVVVTKDTWEELQQK